MESKLSISDYFAQYYKLFALFEILVKEKCYFSPNYSFYYPQSEKLPKRIRL